MKNWLIFFVFTLTNLTSLTADEKTVVYPLFTNNESDDAALFPKERALELSAALSMEEVISKVKKLEERLNKKIFGQPIAVRETVNAIVRYAAGISDPNMPMGSFLFSGPSGVGKTELAKQISVELFGENNLIRINMSEFSEGHSISRLIGAPPGYVGYLEGGELSNRLLKNPFSVVLIDEIEKGHPLVQKLFLQIFDAGYFTSAIGQYVNCRNAIFILTTNLGASEVAELYSQGVSHEEISALLKPHLMEALSPEMYNRLDCIFFAPLGEEIIEQLIHKILDELKARIFKSKKITIFFEQSVVDFLKTFVFDPKLGVRPLKRMVEKELTTALAKSIIENSCKPGDAVYCSYVEGALSLHIFLSQD